MVKFFGQNKWQKSQENLQHIKETSRMNNDDKHKNVKLKNALVLIYKTTMAGQSHCI
jgi:hypothetical protein